MRNGAKQEHSRRGLEYGAMPSRSLTGTYGTIVSLSRVAYLQRALKPVHRLTEPRGLNGRTMRLP